MSRCCGAILGQFELAKEKMRRVGGFVNVRIGGRQRLGDSASTRLWEICGLTEPLEMNADEAARRSESLREIINDLIAKRATGETVTDESLIERHPDLMPELMETK